MSNKVKVSIRALEARARRHALAEDNQIMRKCRADSRWYGDLGEYYFVDASTNVVDRRNVSIDLLIEWCSEQGILKPFEEVALE